MANIPYPTLGVPQAVLTLFCSPSENILLNVCLSDYYLESWPDSVIQCHFRYHCSIRMLLKIYFYQIRRVNPAACNFLGIFRIVCVFHTFECYRVLSVRGCLPFLCYEQPVLFSATHCSSVLLAVSCWGVTVRVTARKTVRYALSCTWQICNYRISSLRMWQLAGIKMTLWPLLILNILLRLTIAY